VPVPWPTGVDLESYLTLPGQNGLYDQAFCDLVMAVITERVTAWTLHVDTEVEIPAGLAHGMVMLGARLFGRRSTPDGTQGNNEFGVVRVSKTDPDVDLCLGSFLLSRIA